MPKNGNGNRPKTLLESLDALIEKYSLLKHPFYRAWTKGALENLSSFMPSNITSTCARFRRI